MARPRDFDENETLAKAVQLFWLKGYNGTSMQDLLDTLALSRSSLYRTYTDKHTLFMKALANYQKFSSAEIRGVVNDADTAKETIRKLLEFTVDKMLSDEQQKGCFMVNSEVEAGPHDKEVLDMVLFNDKELEDALFKILKKGQDSGEIKKQMNIRAMARFYLSILKGIRVTAKSTSDKAVFNDIIEMALLTIG
jgi:TetR/AcrR family transcriptional repressor of nem operon